MTCEYRIKTKQNWCKRRRYSVHLKVTLRSPSTRLYSKLIDIDDISNETVRTGAIRMRLRVIMKMRVPVVCVCVCRVIICQTANEPYVIAVIAIWRVFMLCPKRTRLELMNSYTKPMSNVV